MNELIPTPESESNPAHLMEIDGAGLKELAVAGTAWLKTNQESVNALNIFPVPDGDTGTNMVLTMQAAIAEMDNREEKNAGKVAQSLAQGSLMGARGNSGVILSQIWRGFARAMDNHPMLNAQLLVDALLEARKTAYKGVVRPVEGTILTVIRDISEAVSAPDWQDRPLRSLLEEIVKEADASVKRTPDLLPILKQAGVVDSGGKGLFYLLEGMLRFANGQRVDVGASPDIVVPLTHMTETDEAIEPGQEVEVVVDFSPHAPLNLDDFYRDLGDMGTSIQVGEGEGMYRMHIHTTAARQFEPITYISRLGTWQKIAMENLVALIEARKSGSNQPDISLPEIDPDQIGVVAVSPGKGITNVLASLGANAIVSGGQTMNPSTEEILKSCNNLPSRRLIILPNNKNIILAAENAARVSHKNVAVIPTRTIPQGIAALFRYDPNGDLDNVAEEMKQAIEEVQTGEITVATRTVEVDGVKVAKGQTIALLNGRLIYATDTIESALMHLLEASRASEHELITMFNGEGLDWAEAGQLADRVREAYPGQEIELKPGGQPHYRVILGVE